MKKSAKIAIGVVCGIVAIGIIASASGGSEKATVTSGNPTSSVSGSGDTGTATATVGDTVDTKKLKMSLFKAYTAASLTTDSGYEETPSDGKVYLVLEFEAENISDEKQTISTLYFAASVDGYNVNDKFITSKPDGLSLFSGEIMPGKKNKGYIVYEADKDWQECEVAYTPGFSKTPTCTFVIKSSDIS